MRAVSGLSSLTGIPVDFFGDPDGHWEYEELVRAAGFELDDQGEAVDGQLSIATLTEPYLGFPDGAAVVICASSAGCEVALVDCTASHFAVGVSERAVASHAVASHAAANRAAANTTVLDFAVSSSRAA